MRWLILSFVFVFPGMSFAAVTINEVAWMGDGSSANHEWIELYNNGSAVSVDGWVLSDGMNLSIELTGSIPANSYAVLERTSDDSAPGSAFFIYTGALVNTGAVLSLRRGDGNLEDQVAGGENWEGIGGDNTTKETAQYSTGGWITAEATAGKTNKTVGTAVEEEEPEDDDEEKSDSTNSTKNKSNTSSSEPVKLVLPGVTLKLEVEAQTVGYVNQHIDFSVEPSGIGKILLGSLTYDWNFGDGYGASGKESIHTFDYPGTYVVTVYGSFKRQEQAARHEITILPITLSLTRNKSGDVQVNNDSPYEIDISEYMLEAGKTFVFPARTIMLPNQTITIPLKKVGFGQASLFDAMEVMVVSERTKEPQAVKTPISNVAAVSPMLSAPIVKREPAVNSAFSFATSSETAATTTSLKTDNNLQLAAANTTDTPFSPNSLPYLGLIGIMAVGTLGVLIKPSSNQT